MRARWLKPEFFRDKKIGAFGPVVALVYQALWVLADDGGTAPCDPAQVKGEMFTWWSEVGVPEITGALRTLFQAHRIDLYEVGDEQFAKILRWSAHQQIHKPSKFRYPPKPKGHTTRAEAEAPETPGTSAGMPGTPRLLDSYTPRYPKEPTATAREVGEPNAPVEGHEFEFATPAHRSAYVTFRREAKRPASFDARVAEMVRERVGPGGTVCTWDEIGAALADMAANGMTFNAKLLLGCIDRQRTARPARGRAGKPNGTELNANAVATTRRALSRFGEITGGPAK